MTKANGQMSKEIYLAGGCFWGAEHFLKQIEGVEATEVGYANGHTDRPTYEEVCTDKTGFAETVRVVYDPARVGLAFLLDLYFKAIDPTSVNQQGGDRGTQYRTGIYTVDDADLEIAKRSLEQLQKKLGQKVVVECEPLRCFYTAEEYHQKYLDKNPGGYCHVSWDMIDKAKEWKSGQSTDLK